MSNETIYLKKGRKYIPKHYYNLDGLPEGLYLIYRTDGNKEKPHNCMFNALHYAKVHDIKDIGSFADFYVKNERCIADAIADAFNTLGRNSAVADLTIEIIKTLSKIKNIKNA